MPAGAALQRQGIFVAQVHGAATGDRDRTHEVISRERGAFHVGQADGAAGTQRAVAMDRQGLVRHLTDAAARLQDQVGGGLGAADQRLTELDTAAGLKAGVTLNIEQAAGIHAQVAGHCHLQVAAHHHRSEHQIVDIVDGRVVCIDAQLALEVVGLGKRHVLASGIDGDVATDHPDLAVAHADRAVVGHRCIHLQAARHIGRDDVHAAGGSQRDIAGLGEHHAATEAIDGGPTAGVGQGDVTGARAVERGRALDIQCRCTDLGEGPGAGDRQGARCGECAQVQAIGVGQAHIAGRDHGHRAHEVVVDVTQCQVVVDAHSQAGGAGHRQGSRLCQRTIGLERQMALD